MKRLKKILIRSLGVIVVTIIVLLIIYKYMVQLEPPYIKDKSSLNLIKQKINDSLYMCDDSWLRLNKSGIWEMYVAGSPFELGVKNGKLTQQLSEEQEDKFIEFIKSIIPSEATLNYLKYFIAWFNKDLDKYMPKELQEEIYGVSLFASEKFDFVAPNYHRILNYHAAHDIGHTIQNMNLVECTAFSLKNELTSDSSLLIGRNFDFSAGDDFARNKIIAFCKPDTGYKFMYVTWAGMVGVLSGMNEHGLTITLNSAKSAIPVSAKTPVSAVSRMILQYAKTIDEAYQIAKSYETFVSECFFIGSAIDSSTAIIEKSLSKTILFSNNTSSLILTNHYQSDSLKNTPLNIESLNEGSSLYRYKRVAQLINKTSSVDYLKMASILRNQKGLDDKNIGMGNEKAINQLVCHHSIIFNPEKKIVWVSEFPYQLGKYIAYDLNKVFADTFAIESVKNINEEQLTIPEDTFLVSKQYARFKKYKKETQFIKKIIDNESIATLKNEQIESYLKLNPEYYYCYYIIAEYFRTKANYQKAIDYYNLALSKECPREVDKKQIIEALTKTKTLMNE